MANSQFNAAARLRRKRHIRKKVHGTPERPRLSIFRSAKHIYAQLIDDESGRTIAAASTLQGDLKETYGGNKDGAKAVGQAIAASAKAAGVDKVVFDRNGYLYHGRVAALADAAREAGLDF